MITGSSKIKKLVEMVYVDGIKVIYVNVPYSNHMSILGRLIAFFKFMVMSTYLGLKHKRMDLVISSSTPLSIGVPAIIFNIFKKWKFVFEVRDLWPDVPIALGGIRNNFLKQLSYKLEKLIYNRSQFIVALSTDMREEILKKGVSSQKVGVITNMSKNDIFYPRVKNISVMRKFKLSHDTFKLIHFGAMGIVNGLEYIIDAARIVKEKNIPDIEFILIGEGKRKSHYQQLIEKENLTSVKILDAVPMHILSEIVNICDVSFIGVAPVKILEKNSANKFFDSLSAGKPIIINFGGWMKKVVGHKNCGFSISSTASKELLDKLIYLMDNKIVTRQMGDNARSLAENIYDKSILCRKYKDLINSGVAN